MPLFLQFQQRSAAADGLTYSTVQGNADGFWRSTLRPIATNIGRALGTWLPGRRTVQFDADDYTQPQFAERMQAYATALGAGVYDVDEVRARESLPPVGPRAREEMRDVVA